MRTSTIIRISWEMAAIAPKLATCTSKGFAVQSTLMETRAGFQITLSLKDLARENGMATLTKYANGKAAVPAQNGDRHSKNFSRLRLQQICSLRLRTPPNDCKQMATSSLLFQGPQSPAA